ncbi:hypothetical protein ACWDZ8_02855 [Streptomyces sp. NPDC003233]
MDNLALAPAHLRNLTELTSQLATLRTAGEDQAADQLLARVLTAAEPKTAAAVPAYMRSLGMQQEAARTLAIMSRWTPGEFDTALRAILSLGHRQDCAQMLWSAGQRPDFEVASLLRQLTGTGHGTEVTRCLARVAGRKAAATGAIPSLVAALRASGSDDLLDPLLVEVTTGWPQAQILTLAEDLESAGHADSAYPLYARAGLQLAEQWPATRASELLVRMSSAGATVAADRVLDAMVEAYRSTPSAIASAARTLVAAEQAAPAHRLVGEVATHMECSEVEALADQLNAAVLPALAVQAFAHAAASRPVTDVIRFSDTLRARGYPAQSDELLVVMALNHPHAAATLIDTLRETRRPGRTQRLLTGIRLAASVDDAQDATALMDSLRHTTRADRLLAGIRRAPVVQRAVVAAELWRAHAHADATTLLVSIASLPPTQVVRALTVLQTRSADDDGTVVALGTAVLDRAIDQYAGLMKILLDSGRNAVAHRLVTTLIEDRPRQVGAVARALASQGHWPSCIALLRRFALRAEPQLLADALGDLGSLSNPDIDTALVTALTQRLDVCSFFPSLRAAGIRGLPCLCLESMAVDGSPQSLAVFCRDLLTYGEEADLASVIQWAAGRADVAQVCDALHESGLHRIAYRITEVRAERGVNRRVR